MRRQPTVEIRCACRPQCTLDVYDQGTFFVFEGRDHPYIVISSRWSRTGSENPQVWYVSMKTGRSYKVDRCGGRRKLVRIIEPVHLSFTEVD